MAKQVVYFNATKQIETITIHYNQKLDGAFAEDVAKNIKDISKKMSKVDLKNPKEFENIQVFIYPSKQLFYKIFGGEIEKRFYSRRRSTEDLYVVQDGEGNIHIVSPRGMVVEKRDEFKKILVMKVLGEYMEEKEKQSALRLLKEAMKPKEEEEIEEPDEQEVDEEEIDEPDEEELEQEEIDEPDEEELEQEEIDEPDEVELEQEEIEEPDEQEADEEELEEIIETELVIEQIDEKQEQEKAKENKKITKRSEAQAWLNVGWLAYVNGRLKKEADIKRFAQNISTKGIKKLGQLSNTKLIEQYNFSKEYACAWVEYIVSTYGMNKFAEHYENPKDIKGVFGVSKFVFESQLKSYIKEKYKDNDKVLNITEDIKLDEIVHEEQEEREQADDIAELTVLHFSTTGGVDIETVEPIEKDQMIIE